MCGIKELTNIKSITVYKWVIKKKGEYESPLFHAKIKLGSTENIKVLCPYYHRPGYLYYNDLMKQHNLVSGFAEFEDSIESRFALCFPNTILLKIKLSGNIYSGNGKGVTACGNENNVITYASDFIESIEEVKLND